MRICALAVSVMVALAGVRNASAQGAATHADGATDSALHACDLAGNRVAPISADDLVATFNRQADRLRNVVIIGKFIAQSKKEGSEVQTREVTGTLLAERPRSIRVTANPPMLGPKVFDMASDGREVHVLVSHPLRFYIEPADGLGEGDIPLSKIRPQDLLDAVLWQRVSSGAVVSSESPETARERVLGVRDSNSLRSIHFDETGSVVTRLESSGPERLTSIFRFDRWAPASGPSKDEAVCYPRRIRIEVPRERYNVELLVNHVSVNKDLPPAAFRLDPPAGIEVISSGARSQTSVNAGPKPNGH